MIRFFLILDEKLNVDYKSPKFLPSESSLDITIIDEETNIILYKVIHNKKGEIIQYEDYNGNWYDASFLKCKPKLIMGDTKLVELNFYMDISDSLILTGNVDIDEQRELAKIIGKNISPKLISNHERYNKREFISSQKGALFRFIVPSTTERISKNPPMLKNR